MLDEQIGITTADKVNAARVVTKLIADEEVELTDGKRVERQISTAQAKADLEKLANTAAKQVKQVQTGETVKATVNNTVDAALESKGLKPNVVPKPLAK